MKKIRLTESMNAAKVLGVTNFEMWDYDDCMLEVSPEIIRKLNEKIREVQPTLIITHDKVDLTNPDHGFARDIVYPCIYHVQTGRNRKQRPETRQGSPHLWIRGIRA